MPEIYLSIEELRRVAEHDPLMQNRLAALRALQEVRHERRQNFANLCQIVSMPVSLLGLGIAVWAALH